jgi:hypothetical protein
MKKSMIGIRVNDSIKDKLDELAKKKEISLSQVCDEILSDYFTKKTNSDLALSNDKLQMLILNSMVKKWDLATKEDYEKLISLKKESKYDPFNQRIKDKLTEQETLIDTKNKSINAKPKASSLEEIRKKMGLNP